MKEIVIKVDDRKYELLTKMAERGLTKHMLTLEQAVVNGKVLPKGHRKIIEVTPKLEAILDTYQRYTGIDEMPFEYASEAINKTPALIEEDKGEE